jgi:tRNA1(Val) A37 N6-methylase TrmN6
VIGLILAHCCSGIEVTCLEIQDDLAALATENGRRNRFGGRFRVLRADVRNIAEALPPESFDLIVCNPPYRGRATGRLNRDGQAAHARHELHGDLLDFIRGAAFAVKNRGRVIVVYPARRSATLLATLQAQRLTPKRLQPVYSYPEAEQACLVLVEARKNGGEQVEILAPFFLYNEKNGGYTSAMQAIYQEAPCSPR